MASSPSVPPPAASPAGFLLAVHCKKTEAVDLKAPIAKYARTNFPPAQAADAADDIAALSALRAQAAGLTGSLAELRDFF